MEQIGDRRGIQAVDSRLNMNVPKQTEKHEYKTPRQARADIEAEGRSSASSDEKSQTSSSNRKFTPVFDDFRTAHSLITSGNAAQGAKFLIAERAKNGQRSFSDSSSGSADASQPLLSNRGIRVEGFPVPPTPAYRRGSDNEKRRTYVDQENDVPPHRPISYILARQMSSPLEPHHLLPNTPSGRRIRNDGSVTPMSALSGGSLNNAAVWPSTNPYRDHSPAARLSRLYRDTPNIIVSPVPGHNVAGGYTPSKLGRSSKGKASYDGSSSQDQPSDQDTPESFRPQRASYRIYSDETQQIGEYNAGVGLDGVPDDDGVLFAPLARVNERNHSSSSRSMSSPRARSEGSNVNHILDHYNDEYDDSDRSYPDFDTNGNSSFPGPVPFSYLVAGRTPLRFADIQKKYQPKLSTPTEQIEEEYSFGPAPEIPSPVHLKTSSPNIPGNSSYGDSQELLEVYQQRSPESKGSRELSYTIRREPRTVGDAVGRPSPQLDLGREVSSVLRVFDDDDSILDDMPSPNKLTPVPPRDTIYGGMGMSNYDTSSVKGSSPPGYTSDRYLRPQNEPGFYKNTNAASSSIRVTDTNGSYANQNLDSAVRRNESQRTADSGWETVDSNFEGGKSRPGSSPYMNPRYSGYRGWNDAGSSIADFSDYEGERSSGPVLGAFATNQQSFVHPARRGDTFEKHPRAYPNGSATVWLPQGRRHGHGGFPGNSFRTPRKVRDAFNKVISPLAAENDEEYYELPEIKEGVPSPYSPDRRKLPKNGRDAFPFAHGPYSNSGEFGTFKKRNKAAGLKAQWTDGATPGRHSSSQELPPNSGYRFGMNKTPEGPDSFLEMVIAANDGKLPPQMELGIVEENEQEERRPMPRSWIHSTSSSIADYSTDSDIDFTGPEYQAQLASSSMNQYNQQAQSTADFDPSSPVSPESTQKFGSVRKFTPGHLYKTIQEKRRERIAHDRSKWHDENGKAPGAPVSPQKKGLRPLRLVAEALGPIKPIVITPRSEHEWAYRSPLARIKSKTWECLYSEAHLARINNQELRHNQPLPKHGHLVIQNRHTVMTTTSWDVIPGSPHLIPWLHLSSSCGDFGARKKKISNIALIICSITIIGLPLLRAGVLDPIMVWYTRGEVQHFGSTQKRLSLWIFGGILLAVMIAVAVALVFHFNGQ